MIIWCLISFIVGMFMGIFILSLLVIAKNSDEKIN